MLAMLCRQGLATCLAGMASLSMHHSLWPGADNTVTCMHLIVAQPGSHNSNNSYNHSCLVHSCAIATDTTCKLTIHVRACVVKTSSNEHALFTFQLGLGVVVHHWRAKSQPHCIQRSMSAFLFGLIGCLRFTTCPPPSLHVSICVCMCCMHLTQVTCRSTYILCKHSSGIRS